MTTIAYRDGVLAGDTRVTADDIIQPERDRKVFRFRNGCLFGAAGSSEHCAMLKASVMKDGPTKAPDLGAEPDVGAILVEPNGNVWVTEGQVWTKVKTPYYALGSGGTCAQVAMWCGADAKTAVKAGITHDKNSGGRVIAVHLTKAPPNVV